LVHPPQDNLKKVVQLQALELGRRLSERAIKLNVTDDACAKVPGD